MTDGLPFVRRAAPPPLRWGTIGALVLALALAAGCGMGDTSQPASTQRMVDSLKAAEADARAHPSRYYTLNGLQAERLKTKIDEASGDVPWLRFRYASQLLNAGDTKAAIRELTDVIRSNRLRLPTVGRSGKPLFDRLATAYLRLGEQQNCIEKHASRSCILPITGAGVHTNEEGSRSAIKIYDQLIRRFPDLQLVWLYNIARMTLGEYPDGVPEGLRIDSLAPEPGAAVNPFRDVAAGLGVNHKGLSGGLVMEDLNNDGFLDFFVTSYGVGDACRLYMSDGEGGYVDRTEEAGLAGLTGGLNAVHADYNNDGHEDILVLRGAWRGNAGRIPNSLLRNDGDGTFTDVTFQAGLGEQHPTQTATWADVNRDGWVDLFIGNESSERVSWATGETTDSTAVRHPSALYLNDGDGTFTDVSAQAGVELNGYVKGADWGDVNGDHWPDLYVSTMGGPNRLFVNRPDTSASAPDSLGVGAGGVRFEERARAAGVAEPSFSFPTWFWDYDNDGDDDLFVASYDVRYIRELPRVAAAEHRGRSTNAARPRLYRNRGDGTFAAVTDSAGLATPVFAMGANYGDVDNDGRQDMYLGTGAPDLRSLVPNRLFRNRGDGRFRELTFASGLGHIQKGHAVGFGDVDRDGDQDVYAVIGGAYEGDAFRNALFENPGHGHDWITLDLVGRKANRSALGADVALEVVADDGTRRTIHRTVSSGGSFGSSSLQLEIGLGDADRIAEARITWPTADLKTQTLTGLEPNRVYRVVEGRPATRLKRPAVSLPAPDGRPPEREAAATAAGPAQK
jgi:hypothetical protein